MGVLAAHASGGEITMQTPNPMTIPVAMVTALEVATQDARQMLMQIKQKLELAVTGPNAVLAAAAKGLLYDLKQMLQRLEDRCPCLLGMDLGYCCHCFDCADVEIGDPFEEGE
jgi:hypothetical protein